MLLVNKIDCDGAMEKYHEIKPDLANLTGNKLLIRFNKSVNMIL